MRIMTLCALTGALWLCADSVASAQAETTIGPGPGIHEDFEVWMESTDIQFRVGRTWLGRAARVRWGGQDMLVRDLTDYQKQYLWNMMDHDQRVQMGETYSSIGTMTGPLLTRPRDWGSEMNGRIAEWHREVSGWAEAGRQRLEGFIPREVGEFIAEADRFMEANEDLTAEQRAQVETGKDVIAEVGGLIAQLEARKSEIAVKGISRDILALMAGVLTEMATGGAHYTSAAVATAVSKVIELGQHAIDTSQSPGEMIEVLNQQVAILQSAMHEEMRGQRTRWGWMTRPELSIVFLVDTSGSMRGSKIMEAMDAVRSGVHATNDGRTEWALVRFSGCSATVTCRFTTREHKIIAAANNLRAGGDTPLSYAVGVALTYLHEEGSGSRGRLIILGDGEDNCRERGARGPEEVDASMRPMFKHERDIPMPGDRQRGTSGGAR